MDTHKLIWINDGLTLIRFTDNGCELLSNPKGGGTGNSRGEGGWWLYKGDEASARQDQAQRWDTIKKDMDHYYSQPWV